MSLKKSLKKSIAAFMALSIISSNCYLCGVGISDVIAEEIKEPDMIISLENSKYVQYQNEEYSGVAIQTSLKVNTNQEQENYLPTDSAEILLNFPALNGYFPERASVVTGNTYLTTGEKNNDEINQNYDSNSGLLKVSYENKEMYSTYVEGINDEFEIIYIYPSEAYTGNKEQVDLEYKVDVKMNFASGESVVTTQKTESFTIQEKENKGNLLTFDVTELKDKIYKGFMYSNVKNGTNYDTGYKTVSTLCVLNSKINNEILLEEKENNFITNDEEKTEISSSGLVQYIATGMDRTEFDKILGLDGYMEFYQGEENIATIKYIEVDGTRKLAVIYLDGQVNILNSEDKNLIVKYPSDLTSFNVKLSPAIAEGFIHFENQQKIKASENYGYKIDKIQGIKTITTVNGYISNTNLLLSEPETKVSVTSSNLNFSTLQKNKTTITIKLDDTNASTKLFSNPVITVKLPDGLIAGNLSSPEIVNGNGLNIKNAVAKGNVITIELEGEQKEYDVTNVSGGTSIVMDIENIEFEDTMPTHTEKLEVTCKQAKEEIVADCSINIVSKSGLLILSKLSNYDNANNKITTIDSGIKNVQIENGSEEREAIQSLNLVNNYNEDLREVQIIGRIGYSDEEIVSTFDTKLTKPIQADGKVYYSTNKNASYNDESWQEEFTTDARAYKVELDNNELCSKSNFEIKASIKVPANIDYNQETYLKADVNYICNDKNMSDSSTICMATPVNALLTNNNIASEELTSLDGKDIPISLSIVPNITENDVHSGQLVVYKVRVTNNGTEDLKNITIKDIIPENAIYTYEQIKVDSMMIEYTELTKDPSVKEKEWTIDRLIAGETKEFVIMLTMEDVTEEQKVTNAVNLLFNEQVVNSTSEITLKPAIVSTRLITSSEGVLGITYDVGTELQYYISVTNTTAKDLKNVKVRYEIPENLEYVSGGLTTYDQFDGYQVQEQGTINNNVFEYNIDKIKAYSKEVISVSVKVKQLNNKYEEDIISIAKVYVNDEVYESNAKTITTKQAAYDMKLEVDTNKKDILKKDDIVTYTITVKNIGEITKTIDVKDNIPEQLEVLKIEKDINGKNKYSTQATVQNIEIVDSLDKDDILTVKITAKVKDIEALEESIIEVTNKAVLSSGELILDSNEVTINVKPEVKVVEDNVEEPEDDNIQNDNNDNDNNKEENNDNTNQENNNNNNIENNETKETYTISGVAWIDANKNGQKDADEILQDSVVVSLVDMKIGNFALDTNGNRITTITDSEGKYTFNNIERGTYVVLFEFDTNTYTVTTYQKEGISDDTNSDVILSNVTIDGNKKLAALTDRIELNSNKENIDIGLIQNATFDLSLNKQITKITVINSQGTEVYEYEDGDTAKVDLVAKYMAGSNVIVNYKFTVINEGDVTGYVNSLVDNLPTGLEFSSELNNDWYKGSDGKLYTTSLSGIAIKPGENAEIELVLTKTMTEENAGIFPNNAELDKISNLQNIEESEAAMDNNQSSATLIISIKTGSVAMYAGITIISLAIISVGIYFIKKKVLNRGI